MMNPTSPLSTKEHTMATKNITPKDPTAEKAKVDGDAEVTDETTEALQAQDRKAACVRVHP
jgi:hypothetical protein